jgi:hypothetical protein
MNNFMRAVVAAVIAAGTVGAVIGTPENGPGSVAQAEDAACLPAELAHVPPLEDVPLAAGLAQSRCEEPRGERSEVSSEPTSTAAAVPVAGTDDEGCDSLDGNETSLTFAGDLEGDSSGICMKPRPACGFGTGYGGVESYIDSEQWAVSVGEQKVTFYMTSVPTRFKYQGTKLVPGRSYSMLLSSAQAEDTNLTFFTDKESFFNARGRMTLTPAGGEMDVTLHSDTDPAGLHVTGSWEIPQSCLEDHEL